MSLEINYYVALTWKNKEGQFCREKGPAVIGIDGRIQYCRDNALHRLDGPAMIYSHGAKLYYIYGQHYSKEEYYVKVKKL